MINLNTVKNRAVTKNAGETKTKIYYYTKMKKTWKFGIKWSRVKYVKLLILFLTRYNPAVFSITFEIGIMCNIIKVFN